MIIVESDSKRGSGRNNITDNNSGGRERNSDRGRVRRNIGGHSDSHHSRSRVGSFTGSSDFSGTSNDFDLNPPPYDGPPPAYSLHDEATYARGRSSTNARHDVPRSFERRQAHDGRGHPGPDASSSASAGTAPASALPRNGVSVYECNSSIRGCYIIDPERDVLNSRWSGGIAKNLELSTSNGSIDVDVAVLPPTRPSRNNTDISLHSSCGSINLRMHDAPPHLISAGENRGQQRPMIVNAHSSNGKVHVCIPRSFRGLISATTHNGNIKFSEGIQANMTAVRRTNSGICDAVVFIGDLPEGVSGVSAVDESDSDGHSEDGGNVFIFNETRVPGLGGFFNGARNVTVHSSSFNYFPGDANIVYGVASRGSYHAPPRRTTESSASAFENVWQGSRVMVTSSNGNVEIAYDDEHAFGSFGGWKQQSSDGIPRRRQTTSRNIYTGGNRIDLGSLYEGLSTVTGLF